MFSTLSKTQFLHITNHVLILFLTLLWKTSDFLKIEIPGSKTLWVSVNFSLFYVTWTFYEHSECTSWVITFWMEDMNSKWRKRQNTKNWKLALLVNGLQCDYMIKGHYAKSQIFFSNSYKLPSIFTKFQDHSYFQFKIKQGGKSWFNSPLHTHPPGVNTRPKYQNENAV